ncbi:phosphomannomutase [Pelagibacterium xiamenense]|uniref:phosphomannomutase n=1 Tax=Pelagibacterium xiamenense TaxID=2901140 RepID=UPI001E575844|nr:phosphomannomutase [Pelagibacterium xiamenense]MCD7059667.1 phosphomannomutase [Pelagibacterium xiamenense]
MAGTDIAFGTSGLRGPAAGFTRPRIAAYTRAFLAVCCPGPADRVVIGQDRRASSPAITEEVARALAASGWRSINAGTVPTPALAAYAMARGLPAIMVTGSHTPADQNGLKFYRPVGELLKADEAPIRAAAETQVASMPEPAAPHRPALPPAICDIKTEYRDRYLRAFPPDALEGLSIGVFEHSAAGRDLVVDVLSGLGARCVRFGRTEGFTAVDTEAIEADVMHTARRMLSEHGLAAVVSTDGDGDRPLLIAETGAQITGDVLGAVTARYLGADTVVTPLTSTSAVEASGWFKSVHRTKIGSPYVVEALASAAGGVAVGFEANGGFLQQSPITLTAGALAPLPTRDALLPLIACLATARNRAIPVSQIAADLPPRAMKAGRLRPVMPDLARTFLGRIASDPAARAEIAPELETPCAVDLTDGVRLTLSDDTIVHFRQSGNAPEMRCYVETAAAADTDALLRMLLAHAQAFLKTLESR